MVAQHIKGFWGLIPEIDLVTETNLIINISIGCF